MANYDEALFQARQRLSEGASIEELVSLLRKLGLSKVQSMNALEELTVANARNAKIIVHTSPTWADVREIHDKLHEELEKAFRSK